MGADGDLSVAVGGRGWSGLELRRACALRGTEWSGRLHHHRSHNFHGCSRRLIFVAPSMYGEGRSFVLTRCAPASSLSSFVSRLYALLAGGVLDESVRSFFECRAKMQPLGGLWGSPS